MNEAKLDMHMYKYGYRYVIKQSGAFLVLDSIIYTQNVAVEKMACGAKSTRLLCEAPTKSCKMPGIKVQ